MRISDWSSDVCSSDLRPAFTLVKRCPNHQGSQSDTDDLTFRSVRRYIPNRTSPHSDSYGSPDERARIDVPLPRSEEHTSELQSLMRISYAGVCLKKKYTLYYIKQLPQHIKYKLRHQQ